MDSALPRISIIVPSYQQGEFIERTLRSIFDQGYPNLEVLVFDGGSTDQTLSVLEKAAVQFGDRLRYVSEKDKGQTDAINKGLRQATGEILAYLNSDDTYLPGALHAVAAHFQGNPGARAVYGQVIFTDEEDREIGTYETEPWNYDRLREHCLISQPGCFWRRNVMEEFGLFDESLHFAMDYEYWLRVGKKASFDYIPQRVATARCHANAKTISQRLPAHREIVAVLQRHGGGRVAPNWIRAISKSEAETTLNSGSLAYLPYAMRYWGTFLRYLPSCDWGRRFRPQWIWPPFRSSLTQRTAKK